MAEAPKKTHSVWFDGVDELNTLSRSFVGSAAEILPRAAVVVRKTAADIKRDAHAFCPVDTGALRSSIHYRTTVRALGVEAVIAPEMSYGGHVEWGTAKMAPRAYMGPAADRNNPAFYAAMEQVAGDVTLDG